MRVAVFLTGALRTIRKTIRYFNTNIIQANVGNTIDVFICVQNDTAHTDVEWTGWFREQLGDHMKSCVWFSLTPSWTTQRDLLLQHMTIDESWKGYLRRSGSMIEYAQLQLASLKMTEYESTHHITYDYVIRARTDSIYCKPIDFHWLSMSNEDVADRLLRIQEQLQESKIDLNKTIQYYMTTLISDDIIPNCRNINLVCYVGQSQSIPEVNPAQLNNYVKTGRYILTFRKNNLYIVRRNLFSVIPALANMYGQFKSPYSDAWWFNAEGQFTSICYCAGITTYDYNTTFEDRSVEVNGWREDMFFDADFNCIQPMMMYCVVRR